MNIKRIVKYLLTTHWQVRRDFPPSTLSAIERAIKAAETTHVGEIRFAVEAALEPSALVGGLSAAERAIDVFARMRVWDTRHNNGLLIYLLLAEHSIEIVADRGLHRQVDSAEWQRIMAAMQVAFKGKRFEAGVIQAIDAVDGLLTQHFALAPGAVNPNELPDAPLLR